MSSSLGQAVLAVYLPIFALTCNEYSYFAWLWGETAWRAVVLLSQSTPQLSLVTWISFPERERNPWYHILYGIHIRKSFLKKWYRAYFVIYLHSQLAGVVGINIGRIWIGTFLDYQIAKLKPRQIFPLHGKLCVQSIPSYLHLVDETASGGSPPSRSHSSVLVLLYFSHLQFSPPKQLFVLQVLSSQHPHILD